MDKLKIRYMFGLLTPLFIVSCAGSDVAQTFAPVEYFESMAVFTKMEDYTLAPLEDVNGIILGVHLPQDQSPTGNQILKFEELVGIPHLLYTNTMRLGAPPPELWLLEVISTFRVPNIILTPNNPLSPFDTNLLYDTARYLGQFHVPIFLQLFPEQRGNGYNPEDYIEFFRYAREVFRFLAPQVIFVFTINEGDVLDFEQFYPGNEYVDWVAINMYKQVSHDGNPFSLGSMARLDAFYHTIKRYKPIMINIGVSHFSTINHVYHPTEAGSAIFNFYENILRNYPRVGAIVYTNINTIMHPSARNYMDNFAVTDNETVLGYYRRAISLAGFLGSSYVGDTSADVAIRSPFVALAKDTNLFIPLNTLVHDLNFEEAYLAQHFQQYREEVGGNIFYNTQALLNMGININVDWYFGRIIIY